MTLKEPKAAMKGVNQSEVGACEGDVKIRPAIGRASPKVRCDKHWAIRLTAPTREPLTVWEEMDRRSHCSVQTLIQTGMALVPLTPGVYAFYRFAGRVYVGMAGDAGLRRRLGDHLTTKRGMTDSALRRNTAEHLGIASAADIKSRRYEPNDDDRDRVVAFVQSMEVAWVECATEQEARELEERLKREYLPFLTKR